jgi:hypothetical protein
VSKYGFFPGTGIARKSPPVDTNKRGKCRWCSTPDLVWEQHGDKWRLVDLGGKRHECKQETA